MKDILKYLYLGECFKEMFQLNSFFAESFLNSPEFTALQVDRAQEIKLVSLIWF